jgi:hypothetical protein
VEERRYDVLHQEGERTRLLKQVKINAHDDLFYFFERPGGDVIQLAKANVLRIEPTHGIIARVVDNSRQRDEQAKQAAFKALMDAIDAGDIEAIRRARRAWELIR